MKSERTYPVYKVNKHAEGLLVGGHPWVYENDILETPGTEPENGTLILIGLGIVLKLYQLDIQPEDGIYMRFKQFLYFLDMLVRHCKVLLVHVVQDILHFAVNLEIAPVLPCLGFFGNNRLQRRVHFMQIGQLQAVFTAIAVYLGNTRQYIHLQAGLCLGREIPVSLQERVQCLIRAAGHSVGTSQTVIRRYHPVIAMAEF